MSCVQDITVALISERSVHELDLEVDQSEPSSINKRSFVDEQEWCLYNAVDTRKDQCCKLYESGSRELHPVLAFKCRAARRYGFYTWNICFVMVSLRSTIIIIIIRLIAGYLIKSCHSNPVCTYVV